MRRGLVQRRLSAIRPRASRLSSMLRLGPDSGSNALHLLRIGRNAWRARAARRHPVHWEGVPLRVHRRRALRLAGAAQLGPTGEAALTGQGEQLVVAERRQVGAVAHPRVSGGDANIAEGGFALQPVDHRAAVMAAISETNRAPPPEAAQPVGNGGGGGGRRWADASREVGMQASCTRRADGRLQRAPAGRAASPARALCCAQFAGAAQRQSRSAGLRARRRPQGGATVAPLEPLPPADAGRPRTAAAGPSAIRA